MMMEGYCLVSGHRKRRTMLTELIPQLGVGAPPSWRSSGRTKGPSDTASAGCLEACSLLVSIRAIHYMLPTATADSHNF